MSSQNSGAPDASGPGEVCPELRSREQLINLYGGDGAYQLVALCNKTHRFSPESENHQLSVPPSSRRRRKP